jgi:transketolase
MAEKEMRAVYTEALMGLAEKDERILLLEADLMRANGTFPFRDRFPGRTFNCGVAEANMVSIAAGLSAMGKIPFAGTFGCFATRRAFDQFFISANYARLNVKLVGSDPGITATYNGGTHNSLEDVGLMRTIPNLVIFEPCDAFSLRKLLSLSAYHKGCTYMRLHRKAVPPVYGSEDDFELGRGRVLLDGGDVTLVAAGAVMVGEALKAAELLKKEGVSAAVIDMHTYKPIDEGLLVRYAEKTGAFVTCENHQVTGGLGSAVAETLSEKKPTPLRRIGIHGEFGEVGTLDYLQERFGLTAANIRRQAADLLNGGGAR